MKSKKIHIYLFSGTGNTYLLVKAIHRILTSNDITVEVFPIPGDFSLPDEDTAIGFAFPTAFFSTYPFILDFFDKLPQGNQHETFIISSMASSGFKMPEQIRSILVNKNYLPIGKCIIKMPANYGKNQTSNTLKSQSIIAYGIPEAENFAGKLITNKTAWKKQFAPWSSFVHRWAKKNFFWRLFKKLYPLTTNEHFCQRCGLCKKICPINAIQTDAYDNYIIDDKCCSCQHCAAFCPYTAINLVGQNSVNYKVIDYKEYNSFFANNKNQSN